MVVNTSKFERIHDVARLDDMYMSPISLLIPSGLPRGGETFSGSLEELVQSVKLMNWYLKLEILSAPLIQLHIVRPIPELHCK